MSLLRTFHVEKMPVHVYATEADMGQAAAADVAAAILQLQTEKEEINIIFAAAVSQNEFLNALRTYTSINWQKINAFHMDEYYGLAPNDSHSLQSFLNSHFLSSVPVKQRFFINGIASDPQVECTRYAELLQQHPCDIVFLGIGDNGHLAFNDPHVADFQDSNAVKTVEIDLVSKQQQVNAGNFPDIEHVPSLAFTITIPQLMKSKQKFCIVPTAYKAHATSMALFGALSERCPASILRSVENVSLYLDATSASELP